MDLIEQFSFFSKFLLFPILILSIFYVFVLHPFVMRKKLAEIADFEADARHIGYLSGIAVDFSQRKLAYINRFRLRTFSASDICFEDSGHHWVEVFDKQGSRREKVHEVRLPTDRDDCPEIQVGFWFRAQAQRCMISMRKLYQVQSNFELENSAPATQKVLESSEQEFTDKLAALLPQNGFSRNHIDKQHLWEAVELLYGNYRQVSGISPTKRGTQKIIAKALEPIFAWNSNDEDSSGYTVKSLRKNVSDAIQAIRKSNKINKING